MCPVAPMQRWGKQTNGRKMMVTTVSCFMLSFWEAEMVLKMRSIMPSAAPLSWFRLSEIKTQWSSTSARYVN